MLHMYVVITRCKRLTFVGVLGCIFEYVVVGIVCAYVCILLGLSSRHTCGKSEGIIGQLL